MDQTEKETARDARIRICQQQVIADLSQNPRSALGTHKITGSITEGLFCRVTQGRRQVEMDMGPAMGGDGAAPFATGPR